MNGNRQSTTGNPTTGNRLAIAAGVVATLVLGAYVLFFAMPASKSVQDIPVAPGEPVAATPEVTPDAPPSSAPEPVADGAEAQVTTIPVLEPVLELPALADSDTAIRPELLALLGDNAMTRWLEQEQLIARIAAFVAGLQRGAFSYTALLLEPPEGEFQVERRAGRIYLSPANYERYSPIVGFVDGIDVAAVAEIFHRYRPLFEAAYGELGQPPEQFGDTVMSAIDHLLATPEPATPPELIAESVAYVYVEEDLEGESDARKQLVRAGPAHTQTIKNKLRALRSALAAAPGATNATNTTAPAP